MNYDEMLEIVMKDEVTLEDWKKFRAFYESLPSCFSTENPSENGKEIFAKRLEDFVSAAHHVASILSEEDICKDVVLVLTYGEI